MLDADAVTEEVSRPYVLVADDDDDIRALVVAALRCDGYDVVEARDGGAVLDSLRRGGRVPDAIVTDVRMPVMNGLALLHGLRQEGWRTPVVVMTADGAEQVRDRATRLGANATLSKPFDVDVLRTIVMSVLRPNPSTPASARAQREDEI